MANGLPIFRRQSVAVGLLRDSVAILLRRVEELVATGDCTGFPIRVRTSFMDLPSILAVNRRACKSLRSPSLPRSPQALGPQPASVGTCEQHCAAACARSPPHVCATAIALLCDQLSSGDRFRALTIVDVFTREGLATKVGQ
jgi:hypothetical protein